MRAMKTLRPHRATPVASVLLGIVLVAGPSLLGGCAGERPLAPERTWEEVRYHASQNAGGSEYHDVVVRASGEMEWKLQGQGASTRGLLAGGNLETLTRLIGALPSAGFQGIGQCDQSFFVTVTMGGESRSYSAGSCDSGMPPALRDLTGQFERWIEQSREHRRDPVAFRILAQGEQSGVRQESYRIAGDRDDLVSLIAEIAADRPLVVPSVDFRRERVVGLFLGSKPTAGYAVTVSATYRSEGGQLVIKETRLEPGVGCAPATIESSPFVLAAVERSVAPAAEDILIEPETRLADCGSPARVR